MKKRRRRCAVAAVLLAIIVPTAVVLLTSDRLDPVCPAMDERERVDCHPEEKATRDRCEARGCCWSPAATQGPPSCFYPTNHGYEVDGEVVTTASGYKARLRRLKSPPTPYSGDVDTLEVVVEMQEEHRLHLKILDPAEARYEVLKPQILDPAEARYEVLKPQILDPAEAQCEVLKPQILDPAEARYEVPEAALRVPRPGQAVDNPMYDVTFTHRPFSTKVTRRSTGATIFDTSVGKLTFSDQFLSVSTRLASSNLYGLGEHVHRRYRHDLNWKTWPIFSRGVRPSGNSDNLYGHQPFYMCLEDSDGNANGVFLLNSNAMEVVLQPPVTSVGRVAMPTVTYRVIGGLLDFYMFLGPSPENVVQQYTEMIGRAIMPAYWALGFQLSRWNYTDTNKLRQVVQRNRDTGIPYDVQYGDIDYMENTKDFTYDADLYKGLPDLVQNLHDHGQKYVIILDPAIGNTNRRDGSPYLPYESGLQSDIFVKNADGETDLVSKVWPGTTVFPDFTNPTTVQWWGDHCESFHKVIPYDGLWIDMNEPKTLVNGSLTGCADDRWNHPPYLPAISMFGRMYERTLCMDTLQHWGRHYDVHSLYGHSMAIATHSAMRRVFPDRRGIIITRSNFAGTGQYSGHWLGDNKSAWGDMDWSITGKVLTGLTSWGPDSTPGTGWGITSPHGRTWSGPLRYSGHWLGNNKSAWEDMEWSITGSYRANFVGTGQYSGHWLGDNKSAWEDMEWSITGSYRANFVGTGQYSGHWLGDNKSAWEDMEWSITGSYRANFVGTGQYSWHWLGNNKSAWEDMEWSITGSYRANFVGTGQYSGHWLGDNKSAWEDMEWSITGMLEFGLFGIPYIGADICGFLQNTTEELCQRWMQLGAFYPFARNHNLNSTIEQDPAVFSQSMIDSSRDVMMTRYTLLPYLYTLFYHAHVAGTTVVRPLLHEFPTDSNTWNVDRQFLWGSGLLISPLLTPDTATVDAYFPDTPWYDYFTGHQVEGQYRGQTVTLDAPLNKINVHVRGGTILPTQQPANTTVYSRKNPMGLLVAMDDSSAASGTLFWDDGESIDSVERQDYVFINFKASSTELLCEVLNVPLGGPTAGHWADLRYSTVSVCGLALGTGTPTVRAGPFGGPLQTVAASRVQYDRDNQVLLLTDLNDLDLAITFSLRVIWGQR
ncbi:sucrase-isomaltase, intestinal-like [Branchiostoma lanceolatum]|uniref:sucrase-isomaltase, intestinal-like n=1 Tax=Branchiostoma lanceolatum TaxID=7740 RepID=UPI003454D748